MSNNTLTIRLHEIYRGLIGVEPMFVVEVDGEALGIYRGPIAAHDAVDDYTRCEFGFGVAVDDWIEDVSGVDHRVWTLATVHLSALADELGIEQMPDRPLSGADVLAGFCGHLARGTRVVSRHEADEITVAWREYSTVTAELIAINDERIEDGEVVSYDTISIVRGGETDTIEVGSSEDRGDYEAAVREFLGAGVAFTWLPDGF